MPTISIIVPVYNVENYLDRCISSILLQTFSDWECILIDDGSSDKSGIMCDEYAKNDKRFSVIHKENGGQASARNAALNIARGNYFAFVDSDDCIHPSFLEILYTNINQSNASISMCGHDTFTDNLNTVSVMTDSVRCFTGKNYLYACFIDEAENKQWFLWDKLWHRSCFDNIRLPEGRIYEDNTVVYKIIYETEKIVDCNNVLYFYFQNNSGTVNQKFNLKHLDWLLVPQEMIAYFKEKEDKPLEDKANKIYLNSLVDCYLKTQQYIGDKTILSDLKAALQKLVDTEQKKYPITIETHPQVFEILHPTYSKLYWTIKGFRHKLKH